MLTLTNTNGRLGNHFFRALAAHFIASESGICVKYFRDFSELGLELCRETAESAVKKLNITLGENYFESPQDYTELRYHNVSMMHLYCQSNYMSRKIIDYLRLNQAQIISKNPYKDRYNNNNDVFIHVRLGDVISNNPGFEYYDKILSTLEFGKGYIMGHDYEMNMSKAKTRYNFGVKQAVDEFCNKYNHKILSKAMDGCVSYCIKINK